MYFIIRGDRFYLKIEISNILKIKKIIFVLNLIEINFHLPSFFINLKKLELIFFYIFRGFNKVDQIGLFLFSHSDSCIFNRDSIIVKIFFNKNWDDDFSTLSKFDSIINKVAKNLFDSVGIISDFKLIDFLVPRRQKWNAFARSLFFKKDNYWIYCLFKVKFFVV